MHELFQACSSHRQPSASQTKLFPAVVFFFTKLRETNRTQQVTIVFNVNQYLFFNIESIPQLDKTLGRTGAGQDSWPNWTNLKGLHIGKGFVENKRFFTCDT